MPQICLNKIIILCFLSSQIIFNNFAQCYVRYRSNEWRFDGNAFTDGFRYQMSFRETVGLPFFKVSLEYLD